MIQILIAVIIGGGFIALVIATLKWKEDAKEEGAKIKETRDQKIAELTASATTVIFDDNKERWIAVYEQEGIIKTSTYTTIKMSQLLWVELRVDDNVVAQKSTANIIGRSILGGVLAGGTGAIIGGLSGSAKHQKNINKISVVIGQNDLSKPTIVQEYYTFKKGYVKEYYEQQSQNMLRYAQKVTDLLSVIIEAQDKSTQETENAQMSNDNQHLSVADELKKLKDLLDSGILTPDEFQEQKKKLLEQ